MKGLRLLLAISIVALGGCQTTQVKQASFTSASESTKVNRAFVYSPSGKEEFVFNEKDASLQKYGYDKFCPDTSTFACYNRLPYKTHVGTKGYFDTEKPVKKDFSGYEFYPVVLENGNKYYFVSNKKYGGKYGTLSPIISLSQYNEVNSFSSEPLVPGSDIHLVSNEVSYGSRLYKLSNGELVSEKRLKLLREVSSRYGNTPEIAGLLLGMTIDKDEVENRYFISPQGDSLRSEAKMYIGVNDEKQWLRFKVKYYGDDWLFVNSYKVAADDYRWQSPKMEFKRDNSSGDVWEWVDISATSKEIEVAKKLANADKSTIRFQGSKYYSDKDLDGDQKKSLLNVLKLFELMSGA